jgi:transcriptional regulator with XRE-family HTH domain
MPLRGRIELRHFLRSRRARLTPEAAGLAPPPGSRRVPGLRREEVAQLAGVSVDYYVRLERGRSLNVSEAVLDAVARALRLDDVERSHLFALARPSRTEHRATPPQRVRPGLYQLLDCLGDIPALITGRRLDILAGNRMAHALYTDFDALPHRERNLARYIFLDPAARKLYHDWASAARSVVAILHVDVGRHPQDPQLAELIGDLSRRDDDFRRWWTDHDVLNNTHGHQAVPPPGHRQPHPGLRGLRPRRRCGPAPRPAHRRTRLAIRARPAPAGPLGGRGILPAPPELRGPRQLISRHPSPKFPR